MNRHRDSQPSSLELLDVAGRGGQATVWRLADGATHRLSKVYNPDVVVDVELLRVLVAWRGELSDGDAHFLDERSAWPLVVHDHAGQVAFEMTAAPADFHENVGGFERVRHATLLFARPDALAGLGVPVPTLELRIAICAELADTLAWLHERNVAYGDLSGRNVLWRTEPTAGVFLLDCDGCSLDGSWPATEAADTPGWTVPEGTRKPTIAADCYRFALFVLRSLGGGFQDRDPEKLTDRVDIETLDLLRRSLSLKPSSRPSMSVWASHLRAGGARGMGDDWRDEVIVFGGTDVRVSLSIDDLRSAATDFVAEAGHVRHSAAAVLRAYCAVAREPSPRASRLLELDVDLAAWAAAAVEIEPILRSLTNVPLAQDADCHFAAMLASPNTPRWAARKVADDMVPPTDMLHRLVPWWPITVRCKSQALEALIRSEILALAVEVWRVNAAQVDAEGWKPDPTGDSPFRYWTGIEWTKQIRDGGKVRTERLRMRLPYESPLKLVLAGTLTFQSVVAARWGEL